MGSLQKNQLLGYPDDYGNSMALWQVDPTWWNAKGGLRGERVDLHPLQGRRWVAGDKWRCLHGELSWWAESF